MKSIKSVYKIGNGPSSSHTVGPYHAAYKFRKRWPDADAFRVTLYGSLAFTGEGHGTGNAIKTGLPGAEIIFNRDIPEDELPHPNTMLFEAFKDGKLLGSNRIFSIGGGSIRIENEPSDEDIELYPQNNLSDIIHMCHQRNVGLAQYIYRMEDVSIRDYLKKIWDISI